MDIRKVFDQTVRDLRREVNMKVLKVPEIEQKVLDATSNEPWGPHGTVMSEIAQATRNYGECQMILSILWRRLADTGKNWRHVYKSLTVMEFIVAHGADRAIDEFREHVFQIQGVLDFQYVDPTTGKDEGVNVRKKAQSLVALLSDKAKIREARQKAAANKDKYQGFSSSGTGSKFSSQSKAWNDDKYSGNGRGDKYGSSYDDDKYRDDDEGFRKKDDSPEHEQFSAKRASGSSALNQPVETSFEDDDDDFNPRAGSAAPAPPPPRPAPAPKPVEVDLLDLFSGPIESSSTTANASVDPFSTDLFSSAPITKEPTGLSAFPSAPSTNFGAFSAPPTASDPFAAFGDFQSNLSNQATFAAQSSVSAFTAFEEEASFGDFQTSEPSFGDFQTSDAPPSSSNGTPGLTDSLDFADFHTPPSSNGTSNGTSTVTQSKFEAKLGSIWDDPLSSELINLNISAPKSAALADLGIQITDSLFDEKPAAITAAAPPQQANKPMGYGSGLGLAGLGLSPPPPPASSGASTGFSFFNEKPQQQQQQQQEQTDPFAAFQDEWKFSH